MFCVEPCQLLAEVSRSHHRRWDSGGESDVSFFVGMLMPADGNFVVSRSGTKSRKSKDKQDEEQANEILAKESAPPCPCSPSADNWRFIGVEFVLP